MTINFYEGANEDKVKKLEETVTQCVDVVNQLLQKMMEMQRSMASLQAAHPGMDDVPS